MALATNTTLGTIVLAGDLYGTSAEAPTLAPSGVDAGTSTVFYSMVIDSKGRTIYYADYPTTTPEEIQLLEGMINFNFDNATTYQKGIVQIGNNIDVDNGTISIPDASITQKGLVQAGDNLEVTTGGVLHLAYGSKTRKGIIQVGDGFDITNNILHIGNASTTRKGIFITGDNISLDPDTSAINVIFPTGSKFIPGIVQIGQGISVLNGVITPIVGSTSVKGIVQPGNRIDLTSGVISTNLSTASTTVKGIMQAGSGLYVTNGILTSQFGDATGISKGLIQIGSGLSVSSGIISYSSPDATTSVKGVVQIGYGLNITNGNISLSDATTSTKGIFSLGEGLDQVSGNMSCSTATTSNLGIIRVGTGFNVTDGTISISDATTSSKGIAKAGEGLLISNGILSVDTATDINLGVAKVDSSLTFDSGTSTIGVPTCTTSVLGMVQPGSKFSVTNGTLSINDATTLAPGAVQINSNSFYMNGNILEANLASTAKYGLFRGSVPGMSITNSVISVNHATSSTNGCVIISSSNPALALDVNGLLKVDTSLSVATTTSKGFVKIGSGLSVSSGVLSTVAATTSTLGGVYVTSSSSNGISISNGVITPKIATSTVLGVSTAGGLGINLGSFVSPPYPKLELSGYASTTAYGKVKSNSLTGGTEIDSTGTLSTWYNNQNTLLKVYSTGKTTGSVLKCDPQTLTTGYQVVVTGYKYNVFEHTHWTSYGGAGTFQAFPSGMIVTSSTNGMGELTQDTSISPALRRFTARIINTQSTKIRYGLYDNKYSANPGCFIPNSTIVNDIVGFGPDVGDAQTIDYTMDAKYSRTMTYNGSARPCHVINYIVLTWADSLGSNHSVTLDLAGTNSFSHKFH